MPMSPPMPMSSPMPLGPPMYGPQQFLGPPLPLPYGGNGFTQMAFMDENAEPQAQADQPQPQSDISRRSANTNVQSGKDKQVKKMMIKN